MSADARRDVIERAATELFAERGYHGTSMDEIARRSGVSVPVVYDHFESKEQLHRRLLERHYADLRSIWLDRLPGDDPPGQRVFRALDAWFAYVQSHPYAWRMLFRDTTGDARLEALRREVAAESRALLLPLFAREAGVEGVTGADREAHEMAWEAVRGLIQGLALWWYDHQHVPREQVVATAMNAVWIGIERMRQGELWMS